MYIYIYIKEFRLPGCLAGAGNGRGGAPRRRGGPRSSGHQKQIHTPLKVDHPEKADHSPWSPTCSPEGLNRRNRNPRPQPKTLRKSVSLI